MKITEDRLKIQITFSAYESRLIIAARNILFHCPEKYLLPGQERRCIGATIRLAIVAWCRAVIQNGGCQFPTAADLRPENPIEQQDRLAEKIPSPGIGLNQNKRWN